MAFNKRTWKGRQGTGLNKFSIDGATPVTVINQPDSVTEQGDALSAGNLNDLEDRIYDAFDDIADGTQIVGKATADASGNVITTTYATKSELTSEATARANADSNLLSAIQANSKRITNLETKAGDEIPVTYPSPTYGMDGVPANVAEYAKVSKLRGVSRVDNSFVVLPQSSATVGGLTVTFYPTEHYYTISNGTPSQSAQDYFMGDFVVQVGHKYLIADYFAQRYGADGTYKGNLNTVTDWSPSIVDTTGWASGDKIRPSVRADASQTYSVSKKYYPILTDLNIYFNGSIPSDADTIAEIQTNYPWLLTPSDYGTSAVNTVYEGVRSRFFNIFNPQGATSGVSLSANGGTYSEASHSTSDYLPVRPNVQYYHKNTLPSGSYIVLCYYDENKTFISAVATTNATTTAPPNAKYIRLSYSTADVAQICFNISDNSLNGTVKPYNPPVTLTFPSPISLKSAGAVAEEYYPETGEVTKPLGSHTFDGTESWILENDYFKWNGLNDVIKRPSSATEVPNLLIIGFLPCPWNKTEEGAIYVIPSSFSSGQYIWIKNSSIPDVAFLKTYLNGKTIIYELATPNPNSQATDPILDPFLKVEGGGTIKPIQTQTTEIDSAMTAEYLSLGA